MFFYHELMSYRYSSFCYLLDVGANDHFKNSCLQLPLYASYHVIPILNMSCLTVLLQCLFAGKLLLF